MLAVVLRLAKSYRAAYNVSSMWFDLVGPAAKERFHAATNEMRVIRLALLAEGFDFDSNLDPVEANAFDVADARDRLRYYDGETWEERARDYYEWRDAYGGEHDYMAACAETEAGLYDY